MRKILSTLTFTLLTTAAATAPADTLSVALGGGLWNESPGGNFQASSDPSPVSVTDQLFWGSATQNYLFLTLEHPVPVLPNLRLGRTRLEHKGSGDASFVFDGKTYTGTIDSRLNLQTSDVLLYWELLDNVVSVDLGLNLRMYDIDYRVDSSLAKSSDSFNTTLPMLYGMAGFSPLPGLLIGVEGAALSYGGNGVLDYAFKVSYTTDYYIGLEGGYRSQSLKLDDVGGYDADLSFKGVFGGVYLKF